MMRCIYRGFYFRLSELIYLQNQEYIIYNKEVALGKQARVMRPSLCNLPHLSYPCGLSQHTLYWWRINCHLDKSDKVIFYLEQ